MRKSTNSKNSTGEALNLEINLLRHLFGGAFFGIKRNESEYKLTKNLLYLPIIPM